MQLSRATAGLARGGVACVARLGAAAPPPRRLATAVVACRPAAAPRRLLRLQSTPAAASGQPPSDEEVKGERTSSEWHKQISVLWEGAGEPPEETKSSPLHQVMAMPWCWLCCCRVHIDSGYTAPHALAPPALQALWARKQLAVTLSVMTTVLLYGLVFRDSAFAAVYWTWCMFIAYLCRHPVPRLVVAVGKPRAAEPHSARRPDAPLDASVPALLPHTPRSPASGVCRGGVLRQLHHSFQRRAAGADWPGHVQGDCVGGDRGRLPALTAAPGPGAALAASRCRRNCPRPCQLGGEWRV